MIDNDNSNGELKPILKKQLPNGTKTSRFNF